MGAKKHALRQTTIAPSGPAAGAGGTSDREQQENARVDSKVRGLRSRHGECREELKKRQRSRGWQRCPARQKGTTPFSTDKSPHPVFRGIAAARQRAIGQDQALRRSPDWSGSIWPSFRSPCGASPDGIDVESRRRKARTSRDPGNPPLERARPRRDLLRRLAPFTGCA